jgi:hypothetical protein
MRKFAVTYEVWSAEDSELGATDEKGFELEDGSLREAIDAVTSTRTSAVDGVECIEPSCSVITEARWITITNGMEYETGARESRSLHIPDSVTGASRKRIARLLGVNGA